jgi:hypothetical protein
MGKTFSTGLLTNGIWQDSSNNIGIGAAANASFKLQVTGATNLTGALSGTSAYFSSTLDVRGEIYVAYNATYGLRFYNDARNNWSSIGNTITGSAAANLVFKTGNGTALTLDNSGAATFSSSVTANTTVTARVGYTTPGNSTNPFFDDALIFNPSGNGTSIAKISVGNQYSSDYGTALKFTLNQGSGPNLPIDVMTLRSTGNVGIGTSSPTFADGMGLHINNNTGAARLHLTNNTTGGAATDGSEFTLAGSDLYIINNESANTLFYNGGSPRMTITSGGNVCINTTLVKSRLGTNTKFTVAGSGSNAAGNSGASMGAVAGTGSAAIDTGIDIEATDGGLTLLFLASRNTSGGTNTASAVYIISFYYSGTFPVVSYIGGTSNFVTFGQSGTSLTATNAIGYGNFNCSWFASK